jgi:hypothetical protein
MKGESGIEMLIRMEHTLLNVWATHSISAPSSLSLSLSLSADRHCFVDASVYVRILPPFHMWCTGGSVSARTIYTHYQLKLACQKALHFSTRWTDIFRKDCNIDVRAKLPRLFLITVLRLWHKLKWAEVKLSLYQAIEAHRAVRRRGSHVFLDNRLIDVGKVVSLMRLQPFTPRKIPGL